MAHEGYFAAWHHCCSLCDGPLHVNFVYAEFPHEETLRYIEKELRFLGGRMINLLDGPIAPDVRHISHGGSPGGSRGHTLYYVIWLRV